MQNAMFATVSGGQQNVARAAHATVSGGFGNTASGSGATVSGGGRNQAIGDSSTVAGGVDNRASGAYAAIPGGGSNVAAGAYSFAAGRSAKANHAGSFVWADQSTDLDFASTGQNQFLIRASGKVGIGTTNPSSPLTVAGIIESTGSTPGSGGFKFPDGTVQSTAATGGGGVGNTLDGAYDQGGAGAGRTITADAGAVHIAGGGGLTVAGWVGVGTQQPAAELDVAGTVRMTGFKLPEGAGQGLVLTSEADGVGVWRQPAVRVESDATSPNLIGGFNGNRIHSTSADVGIAGAVIGGGGASGQINEVTGGFGTISGGRSNTVAANDAPVGGGQLNSAYGGACTIGGGARNYIGSPDRGDLSVGGDGATVSGGQGNGAQAPYATIGGGSGDFVGGRPGAQVQANQVSYATVSGGRGNRALAAYATVSGGWANFASGTYAAVPGGQLNQAAGQYSFAAGRRAMVESAHGGTFIWADDTDADYRSTGPKQFLIRAGGGVGIGTDSPAAQLHVKRAAGAAQMSPPEFDHAAIIESADNTNPDVLALKVTGLTPADRGINFASFMVNDVSVGAIRGGTLGVQLVSPGNDFAEYLPRLRENEVMEPGDVIGVIDGHVTRTTRGAHQLMVITYRPVLVGNCPPHGNEGRYEKVAFIGQVPVRVRGPVRAGDYVVASGQEDGTGVAVSGGDMTAADCARVVGQAWESSPDAGVRRVNVAVGLPVVTRAQQTLIESQAGELQTLIREVAALKATVQSVAQANRPSGAAHHGTE
ncbi:MAG: hypothetical protein AB1505_11090 [Candidatus Latescibacterota bacterium]